MDVLDFAARPLGLIARGLLWLAWDLLFLTVAWSIGWPIMRVLTFGRFPHVGIRDYEHSSTAEAFFTCAAGIGVLVAAIIGFSAYSPGAAP